MPADLITSLQSRWPYAGWTYDGDRTDRAEGVIRGFRRGRTVSLLVSVEAINSDWHTLATDTIQWEASADHAHGSRQGLGRTAIEAVAMSLGRGGAPDER